METKEKYMNRCIELAQLGAGNVSPNPMVGCVIVYNKKIIGEGFHKKHGEAHAEVNAINSIKNPELLKKSTLYVSLEPCAHYGLTPPCSDLIINKQIPKVIIGTSDSFSKVAGKGITKLKQAGIEVEVGILEKKCRELNKRFFTFHEKKRPYVILKWAQTIDGFIDINRQHKDYGEPTWITENLSLRLVHKIRSEEDAIIVGTNTAEKDNPSLSLRHWSGKNPVRVVIDNNLRLSKKLNLFDNTSPTLIFNSKIEKKEKLTEYIKIDFDRNIIPQILTELYKQHILSVIVEGGAQLINSFFSANLWDEAHVFIGNKLFYNGVPAPHFPKILTNTEQLDNDKLMIFENITKE